jgi:hypothetical protein
MDEVACSGPPAIFIILIRYESCMIRRVLRVYFMSNLVHSKPAHECSSSLIRFTPNRVNKSKQNESEEIDAHFLFVCAKELK